MEEEIGATVNQLECTPLTPRVWVAIHKSGGHVKPSGVRCIVTFPSGTVRTKIAPAPGAQSQIEKYNVVLPDKQEFLLLNHGDINVLSLYQEVKSKKERVS